MSWRNAFVPVLLGLLALAACMSPSTYRPAMNGDGYRDQQLADGRYRVSFAGNEATPRATVENYMLYRAAEIALESGGDYFVVLRESTDADVTTRTYYDTYGSPYPPYYAFPPRPMFSRWPGYGFGHFYDPYDPLRVPVRKVEQRIVKFRATAMIEVFRGTPEPGERNAYDARDLTRRLAGSVVRPPP